MVMAPNNALTACHVAVGGAVAELPLFPDCTALDPPEVAASAAEPPEGSVVSVHESLPCPVTTMEAVFESLPCPVTAMEAVSELSVGHDLVIESVVEPSICPVFLNEPRDGYR